MAEAKFTGAAVQDLSTARQFQRDGELAHPTRNPSAIKDGKQEHSINIRGQPRGTEHTGGHTADDDTLVVKVVQQFLDSGQGGLQGFNLRNRHAEPVFNLAHRCHTIASSLL
jgi:hypothetical protein